MRLKHVLTVLLSFLLAAVHSARPAAQVELDRVVGRVNGKIITQSDIQQARLLRLVDNTSSDEATRRGLEDRMLILGEIDRASGAQGADADFRAKRSAYETSIGGRGRVSELVARTSLGENGLDAWLRDDVRIEAYLKRQFGSLPDAERNKAVADWVGRLRQRAGLK